jgi:hypothetical protein
MVGLWLAGRVGGAWGGCVCGPTALSLWASRQRNRPLRIPRTTPRVQQHAPFTQPPATATPAPCRRAFQPPQLHGREPRGGRGWRPDQDAPAPAPTAGPMGSPPSPCTPCTPLRPLTAAGAGPLPAATRFVRPACTFPSPPRRRTHPFPPPPPFPFPSPSPSPPHPPSLRYNPHPPATGRARAPAAGAGGQPGGAPAPVLHDRGRGQQVLRRASCAGPRPSAV